MTIKQLREKLTAYLTATSTLTPEQQEQEFLTLDVLGTMLGTEFWLLLMYQQPCDPETLNRIAKALEKIERKMPAGYGA